MKFQNDRGGRIVLQDIKRPAKDEWGTGLDAMQAAMELEKAVNKALLDLHKVADKHSDFMVSFGFIAESGLSGKQEVILLFVQFSTLIEKCNYYQKAVRAR